MMVSVEQNRIVIIEGKKTLWLEPWGKDAFRDSGCISAASQNYAGDGVQG